MLGISMAKTWRFFSLEHLGPPAVGVSSSLPSSSVAGSTKGASPDLYRGKHDLQRRDGHSCTPDPVQCYTPGTRAPGQAANLPHADQRHLGALLCRVAAIIAGRGGGRRAVCIHALLEGQCLAGKRVARRALAAALACCRTCADSPCSLTPDPGQ